MSIATDHTGVEVDGRGVSGDESLVIQPGIPPFGGIFALPGRETPIASHEPHSEEENWAEHLHAHLPHLHVSYGFKLTQQQNTELPDSTHLEVAMAILTSQRVDCNPIFVGKNSEEGVCLKIAGEDVHWIHSTEVSEKAQRLFAKTGRRLPSTMYFAGFRTSTVDERQQKPYTRAELSEAIGDGLICEQHFQATWREASDEPIEPYDVVIYLGDSATNYHTFFRLPTIMPLGAF
jgi:hypothetical protein